jgi:hypothetical protein
VWRVAATVPISQELLGACVVSPRDGMLIAIVVFDGEHPALAPIPAVWLK